MSVPIAMTAPTRALWLPCERCTRAGSPSRLDPRFCSTCLPDPETAHTLAAFAGDRHRRAHAAVLDETPTTELAVAPDARHVWTRVLPGGAPHLFRDGEVESYCAKVAARYPVRVGTVRAVGESVRACRSCWISWRAGRRA